MMLTDQLDTPVAVVDLDILEDNIQSLQSYLDSHDIDNLPHIKTHKIPAIAHKQIIAGAAGITCQKLGEAEIMAREGIQHIFLPYNIIGSIKLSRLMRLAQQIQISVTADSTFVVDGLAQAALLHKLSLPLLVEFDIGFGRCGVQTPQQAADLARQIERQPHLVFDGLMTYPVNERTGSFVQQTRTILRI